MDIVQLMENNEPKAMATVVEAVDGLENYPTKAETDKAYLKVPTTDELWAGGWFMNGSQTVTPKKKLSECANGWLQKTMRQQKQNSNIYLYTNDM